MKAAISLIKKLVILSILMSVGCATPETRVVTRDVHHKVCIQDSAYYGSEFSYPCAERQKAQTVGAICECMATSASILIETNRLIGPTSARALLDNAVRGKQGQAIQVIYDTLHSALGKTAAEAYIKDIAKMSVYIADRNITDRVTFPNQKYKSCVSNFNYSAQ